MYHKTHCIAALYQFWMAHLAQKDTPLFTSMYNNVNDADDTGACDDDHENKCHAVFGLQLD